MKCPYCGCENPDDYNFCHDCGSYLKYSSQDDFTSKSNSGLGIDSKKLIILGYIIAILFGWGSFIFSFLFRFNFIGFIGLFFPGFMLSSKDANIRKHAYIQLAIMVVGIIFTFLLLFR